MNSRVIIAENSRTALTGGSSAAQGSKWRQYLAATLATLIATVGGCLMSWTSPALQMLQSPNSTMYITDEEGSWAGSLLNVGAFLGALPAGLLADKIGRKGTLLLLAWPLLAAWCLLAFAPSVIFIYNARLLAGIAVGAVSVVAPMYITELAESSVRGALGTLFQLQITLGVLLGYFMGTLIEDYCLFNVAMGGLPTVFFFTFIWMPESPFYLITRSRNDDAHKALQWFRGSNYEVEGELEAMQESMQETQCNKASICELMTQRGSLLALIISIGLMTFQQLSGINAVIFYSGKIFSMAGSSLSPGISSVIIGAVQVLATYLSTLLVDRAGRRLLLLFSSFNMALCLSVLGAYFCSYCNLTAFTWLPIAALAIFIVAFSVGFGPLPWMMLGELFPPNVKGAATAITASFAWILAFAVTKLFQNMLDTLGTTLTFWIFAINCIAGTIFTAALVPETKGKSLEEIQVELSGKRNGVMQENLRTISLGTLKPV